MKKEWKRSWLATGSVAVSAFFFTHCGSCGSDPKLPVGDGSTPLDAPNSGNDFVVLATSQQRPTDIAVDDTHVYWLNQPASGAEAIVRVAKSGGTPTVLVSGIDSGIAIGLDASNVYFTHASGVSRIAKTATGGTATVVAMSTGGGGITVHEASSTVYWTDYSGSVLRAPTTGGTPTTVHSNTLISASPWPLVFDGNQVLWATFVGATAQVLSGGVSGGGTQMLGEISVANTGNGILSAVSSSACGSACFGFWIDPILGRIRARRLDGSGAIVDVVRPALPDVYNPLWLARVRVDGSTRRLYFTTGFEVRVVDVTNPTASSAAPVVASTDAAGAGFAGLAVDDTRVYVADRDRGMILAARR